MKALKMPKFTVTVTHRDGTSHRTEGWGVVRKSDAEQIIRSEIGLDRATAVEVRTPSHTWKQIKAV